MIIISLATKRLRFMIQKGGGDWMACVVDLTGYEVLRLSPMQAGINR